MDINNQDTIWTRIKSKLPTCEIDEVSRLLGIELIEKNEDLKEEVNTLKEILADFQQQNEKLRVSLKSRPRLPDHPARVLLEQQIMLLIKSVKHSSSAVSDSNSQNNRLLSPKNKSEEKVLQHVLKKHDPNSNLILANSDTSPLSRFTKLHASRPGTASSNFSSRSGTSSSSAPPDLLDPMENGKLNMFRICKVTKDIKAAMREESQELMEEIEYIQSLLEMEHEEITEEKNQALTTPPSLDEMRAFSQKLEKTWLLEDSLNGKGALHVPNLLSPRLNPDLKLNHLKSKSKVVNNLRMSIKLVRANKK